MCSGPPKTSGHCAYAGLKTIIKYKEMMGEKLHHLNRKVRFKRVPNPLESHTGNDESMELFKADKNIVPHVYQVTLGLFPVFIYHLPILKSSHLHQLKSPEVTYPKSHPSPWSSNSPPRDWSRIPNYSPGVLLLRVLANHVSGNKNSNPIRIWLKTNRATFQKLDTVQIPSIEEATTVLCFFPVSMGYSVSFGEGKLKQFHGILNFWAIDIIP